MAKNCWSSHNQEKQQRKIIVEILNNFQKSLKGIVEILKDGKFKGILRILKNCVE